MEPQKKFKVQYDFFAENVGELNVSQGELLLAVSLEQDGWIKVKSITNVGNEGFVPVSYLEEIIPPAKQAPARAAPRPPPAAAAAGVTMQQQQFQTPFVVEESNLPAIAPPPPAAIRSPALPNRNSSSANKSVYGAPQAGFLQPSSTLPMAKLTKQSSGRGSANRGGGEGAIVKDKIDFQETLGVWRERERRFILGEKERLPKVKPREYYYWDRSGVRRGPFTEAEMKAHFDTRQVTSATMISIASSAALELPPMSVNEYFPDANVAFVTAPVAPEGSAMWQYVDDNGEIQGPFSAEQMREWFQDGYFNAETKAKLASRKDAAFVPLGKLFPEGEGAFLSNGNQDAATAAFQQQVLSDAQRGAAAPYVQPPAAQAGFELLGMALSSSNNDAYNNPFGDPSVFNQPAAMKSNVAYDPWESPAKATNQQQQQPRDSITQPVKWDEDGWAFTWDDEKEEVGDAQKGSKENPEMAIPVNEASDIKVAKYADISKRLKDYESIYKFLTRALPKELGTVRCRIKRSITGMMHINYNVYELFLELDDGKLGPQIIVANKYKTMGIGSYFHLSIGAVLPTHSGLLLGEVTLNTLGTQWLLHNDVKGHQGVAKDLACIHYSREHGGPRKMQVGIPGFQKGSEAEFTEWSHAGSIKKSRLVSNFTNFNFDDIQALVNKPPVWNAKRNAWCLNFHGRVSKASVKNFQLVTPQDHDHIVLQHGRVGGDSFTMDISWPISPIQAFAVCLSSLHGKLGVE